MGTGVVDRKVLPVHVEDGDLLSAHLDPLSTPKGDVLRLCYLHKSCHGSPPLSLSIDGLGVMLDYLIRLFRNFVIGQTRDSGDEILRRLCNEKIGNPGVNERLALCIRKGKKPLEPLVDAAILASYTKHRDEALDIRNGPRSALCHVAVPFYRFVFTSGRPSSRL